MMLRRSRSCPLPRRTTSRCAAAAVCAYSDWLRARAQGHDPRSREDEIDEAIDRETEAVSRLIGERAWYGHHIWQKLSLLDFYLGDCDDSWTDKRCARLLASMKADLRTHGIGATASR